MQSEAFPYRLKKVVIALRIASMAMLAFAVNAARRRGDPLIRIFVSIHAVYTASPMDLRYDKVCADLQLLAGAGVESQHKCR
ncbi:hypothetical protein E4K72_01600 [Oxalobacteraceae bacterium OM1]|nr:hypothetical protein E4K72_01600 [Oxalobacteraceae bacterium OM1]